MYHINVHFRGFPFLKFGNQNCTAFLSTSYQCIGALFQLHFHPLFLSYHPWCLLLDLNQTQLTVQGRLAVFVFVTIHILIRKTHIEIYRLVT